MFDTTSKIFIYVDEDENGIAWGSCEII